MLYQGDGCLRQPHGEDRSPARPALHGDRSAMRLHDPLGDREAEPNTGRSPVRERAGSARQKRSKMCGRSPGSDADAGIPNREGDGFVVLLQASATVPPRGVYLMALVTMFSSISRIRCGSTASRTGESGRVCCSVTPTLSPSIPAVSATSSTNSRRSHSSTASGARPSSARARVSRLSTISVIWLIWARDLVQRLEYLGRDAGMDQRPFDAGPKDHQRGLQLMAGVGGEAVQAAEALLQPREHAVDRECQPSHLVARERYGKTTMQAPPVGDGLHLIHDLFHRTQAGAGQPVPDQPGTHQDDRRDEQHGPEQVSRAQGRLRGSGVATSSPRITRPASWTGTAR